LAFDFPAATFPSGQFNLKCIGILRKALFNIAAVAITPLFAMFTFFIQAWWCVTGFLLFRNLRQEDRELRANLGYIVKPYLKNKIT
jgi:protein-S-isoprenylcysteine O-methyltransferase Ste14